MPQLVFVDRPGYPYDGMVAPAESPGGGLSSGELFPWRLERPPPCRGGRCHANLDRP